MYLENTTDAYLVRHTEKVDMEIDTWVNKEFLKE